jgi:ABC-type Na+ efflux pump permease subunit
MDRRGVKLVEGEAEALIVLFGKTLPWLFVTVILCVGLMMLGFFFTLNNVDLGRFAEQSGRVQDLVMLYSLISAGIVFLLIVFCLVATWVIAHNIIAPIVRIARELASGEVTSVAVRKTDRFLIPLVNEINRLLKSQER